MEVNRTSGYDTFWEIGKSSPKDEEARASGDPSLSPSEAEVVLSELANTYSKDLIGSLGGLHHFFERLDEKPVTEQQLPAVESRRPRFSFHRKCRQSGLFLFL